MSTITTKDGTKIFYKDWGPRNGQPIVFSHGWPLSSEASRSTRGAAHGLAQVDAERFNTDVLDFGGLNIPVASASKGEPVRTHRR
jgi:pimeloyl-ACP methyl ester carboxylesterase